MSRYHVLLITAAIVIGLDQATKLYIAGKFLLHESVTIFDNFLHITHVRNKGAAFGFLAEHGFGLPFFIIVAVTAAVGIVWYLRKLRPDQRLLHFALSLIFAGALGNLIDRIRLGSVIDFIDVHWYHYHWPAFNVADSAITVGVGLLLIDLWIEEKRRKS